MKPLLVGESNPYGSDPHFALYPRPKGSAGHRLCTTVLGLREADYLERFDRVNLCAGEWSMVEAIVKANNLCHEVFVLLGRKVFQAFLPGPWETFTVQNHCSGTFVILPHPSGLSRGWNAYGSFVRAQELLRSVGALP